MTPLLSLTHDQKPVEREIFMKQLLMVLLSTFALTANAVASGHEGAFYKHFNHQDGVAVHGYDVVAYFQNKVELGLAEHEVIYNEVTFRFANAENARTFDLDPEKYLPAYGGWCATAMGAMNQKLDITPDSFLVEDGVLYLFSTSMGPAKDMWLKEKANLKVKADENWAKIITE